MQRHWRVIRHNRRNMKVQQYTFSRGSASLLIILYIAFDYQPMGEHGLSAQKLWTKRVLKYCFKTAKIPLKAVPKGGSALNALAADAESLLDGHKATINVYPHPDGQQNPPFTVDIHRTRKLTVKNHFGYIKRAVMDIMGFESVGYNDPFYYAFENKITKKKKDSEHDETQYEKCIVFEDLFHTKWLKDGMNIYVKYLKRVKPDEVIKHNLKMSREKRFNELKIGIYDERLDDKKLEQHLKDDKNFAKEEKEIKHLRQRTESHQEKLDKVIKQSQADAKVGTDDKDKDPYLDAESFFEQYYDDQGRLITTI